MKGQLPIERKARRMHDHQSSVPSFEISANPAGRFSDSKELEEWMGAEAETLEPEINRRNETHDAHANDRIRGWQAPTLSVDSKRKRRIP
jgi:hypothetical protein